MERGKLVLSALYSGSSPNLGNGFAGCLDNSSSLQTSSCDRRRIATAEYTEDEHFGLWQGLLTEIVDLGTRGYVMMRSGTVWKICPLPSSG